MNLRSMPVVAVTTSAILMVSFATFSSPGSAATKHFEHPVAIALDSSGHVWVTNSGTDGVTEIDAATGKVIRSVDAKADRFNAPTGVAVDGEHVWVVSGGVESPNGTSNVGTVTELDESSGALIRTIKLKKRGVTGLSGVSAGGSHVWITADGGARVAELSNVSGAVLHVYRTGERIVDESGIDVFGTRVWIVSPSTAKGIVERNAVTGAKIRAIVVSALERPKGSAKKLPTFLSPLYVTADAHHVWTANVSGTSAQLPGGSVSEIDPTTGRVIQSIDAKVDRFESVRDVVSDGLHVWVVSGTVAGPHGRQGDSITELSATTGNLVRVIRLRGTYSDPTGLASNGVDVWVVDTGGGKKGTGDVVELNASNGAVVRTIS